MLSILNVYLGQSVPPPAPPPPPPGLPIEDGIIALMTVGVLYGVILLMKSKDKEVCQKKSYTIHAGRKKK